MQAPRSWHMPSLGLSIALISVQLVPAVAEADCGDTYAYTAIYPEDGATQVPTNARLLLNAGKSPDANLVYDDAPETPVAGSVVLMGELVWFVPASPLQSNKAMTLLNNGTKLSSFVTGAGPDTTAPSFAGITDLKLIEGTVDLEQKKPDAGADSSVPDASGGDMTPPSDGGGCGCGGGSILLGGTPEPQDSEFDIFNLEFDDATDDTAPAEVLIYRVYTYPTSGAQPTEAAAVVLSAAEAKATACGTASECATPRPGPFPSFDFIVGQTACMAIEVEDPAGNVTSAKEVCGVVEAWKVDGYCAPLVRTTTPEDDGGVAAPDSGADSGSDSASDATGADTTADEDAARNVVPPSDQPGEDGCSCNATFPSSGSLSALWLLVLLLRRRFPRS